MVRARPLISPTGNSLPVPRARATATIARQPGFTLLEILVALGIAALFMTLAVPSGMKLYDSMQYRAAVRDVMGTLNAARYAAANTGLPQDVEINPRSRQLRLNGEITQLADNVTVIVHATRELNRDGIGVIRFYPEGGSSGGSVDLARSPTQGVSVDVDWLAGGVRQVAYAAD